MVGRARNPASIVDAHLTGLQNVALTGSVLIAGTASDVGKSVLTAGICRWLARQGVRVAPFKAQNMSNNSVVAPDGAEIGRAQAMQAAACGVPAEAAMNPVLLKPGSDLTSQVVLLGRAVGDTTADGYWGAGAGRERLLAAVLGAYDDLRSRFDVVVCEGAGSPAEINLRRGDLANMGLARARDLPVVVIGDIDRGGVFAALYGTLALLEPADQALISAFVINKFRGDQSLLTPGLDELTMRAGRPVLGVVPFLTRTWVDAEDAVAVEGSYGPADAGETSAPLRVAVLRLPRISNFTDVDALALEPGVCVRFVSAAPAVADADLVILPGTKATVADLAWLRARGLDRVLASRAAAGRPILGICGGYQMLGTVIDDAVESKAGTVPGLGLLPTATRFAPAKTLRRPAGYAGSVPVAGYEIHHGLVEVSGGRAWFTSRPSGEATAAPLDGCQAGAVSGTLWHGIFENDAFRRAYLAETARLAGCDFIPAAGTCFAAARRAQFDALADAIETSLDTGALLRLIEHGPDRHLPLLPTSP
jgi:adenosylcobyric acid synthase